MQADASPTPYPELNMVLAALLEGVTHALGENLIGLYLQGSFAVGDFTPWSDCDFIVVTREDLSPDQLAALQRLHPSIHELPAPYWRNGLEGSYAPAAILRRWSTDPRDPPGEPRGDDWADPASPAARRRPIRSGISTTARRRSFAPNTTTRRSFAGACANGASCSTGRIRVSSSIR